MARRAGVTRTAVSDLETGHIDRLRVELAVRILAALGGRIDFVVRWQGGELDRLLNARHSALHESVAKAFAKLDGWVIAPEVSFNVRGERGIIDILCWHAGTQTLLVVELKTEIVDINELIGTLDRKTRLASSIARERGWFAREVCVWLIVGDSLTNRRRVRAHAATLRAALPADGRTIRTWLIHPAGSLRCLSFWSNVAPVGTKSGVATVKRVRRREPSNFERG